MAVGNGAASVPPELTAPDPGAVALHLERINNPSVGFGLRCNSIAWLIDHGQLSALPSPEAKQPTTFQPLDAQGVPRPSVGNARPKPERPRREIVLEWLDQVQREEVEWLWPNRIPLGMFSLVAGDMGLGKSQLCVALAAVITTGGAWPDAPEAPTPRGRVLYLTAEDSVKATIRPRMEDAGADFSRVGVFKYIREGDIILPFTLGGGLDALDDLLSALGDVRLIYIDPISDFLGGTDEHKNGDIRGMLWPLCELAEAHRTAIVAVTHFNKGSGTKALYRTMGTVAFPGKGRVVSFVMRDPADRQRLFWVQDKNNIGPLASTLAFRCNKGRLIWEEKTIDGIYADDLLRREAGEAEAGGGVQTGGWPGAKNTEAETFILRLVADGEITWTAARDAATTAGIPVSTFRLALAKLEAKGAVETPCSGNRKIIRPVPKLNLNGHEAGSEKP